MTKALHTSNECAGCSNILAKANKLIATSGIDKGININPCQICFHLENVEKFTAIRSYSGNSGTVLFGHIGDERVAYKFPKTHKNVTAFYNEIETLVTTHRHPLLTHAVDIIHYNKIPILKLTGARGTLSELLTTNTCDPTQSIYITTLILISFLHLEHKGIQSHQDIKPDNILIYEMNLPASFHSKKINYILKISDLGLANVFKESGHPGGTWPYKAPEQYSKKNKHLDRFAPDIFACGAILFQLLTGKHPCGLSNSEIHTSYNSLGHAYWEKWANLQAKVIDTNNTKLNQFIAQSLAPDPTARPTTKEALLLLLDSLYHTDKNFHAELSLLFSYYDFIAHFENQFSAPGILFKIPTKRDSTLHSLHLECAQYSPLTIHQDIAPCYCEQKYIIGRETSDITSYKDIVTVCSRFISSNNNCNSTLGTYFSQIFDLKNPTISNFEYWSSMARGALFALESLLNNTSFTSYMNMQCNDIKSAYHLGKGMEHHDMSLSTHDRHIDLAITYGHEHRQIILEISSRIRSMLTRT